MNTLSRQPQITIEKEKKLCFQSDSEDEDEEFLDEMTEAYSPIVNQAKVVEMQRNRKSISAEVFGKFNSKAEFSPKTITKSAEIKAKIKARLAGAFMFMNLDDTDMDVVIDAMDSKTLHPDEYCIKEKEQGEELYIVETGQLACWKVFDGKDTFLKHYNSGDVFGELALLYNAPRAASIKAETECQLWVLDRNTFNFIVKEASQKKRQKYERFLSTVKILQNMDIYERSKFADAVKEQKVAAGQKIITKGEEGETFYILLEGEA